MEIIDYCENQKGMTSVKLDNFWHVALFQKKEVWSQVKRKHCIWKVCLVPLLLTDILLRDMSGKSILLSMILLEWKSLLLCK